MHKNDSKPARVESHARPLIGRGNGRVRFVCRTCEFPRTFTMLGFI